MLILLAAGAPALAGCASSGGASAASGESARSDPSRVRCLSDPRGDSTTRPMFFLFCVESP